MSAALFVSLLFPVLLAQAPVPPAADFAAPKACRPAPYEDCGEDTFQWSPARRWGMDDNRWCPQGPGIDCSVPGTGENPNPYWGGPVDAVGCVFEMYVVADCGSEFHVPLCDVESGTIRVLDPAGVPVWLHAANGLVTGKDCDAGFPGDPGPEVPFDEEGYEISWSASRCTDGDTGGPGNWTLMDVWFYGGDDSLSGDSLCGVYTVQFESWAGCGWELFANCDGTNTPQFFIYDDRCDAQDAHVPLPELILENLQVTPSADFCSVDYCVDVRNVGCLDPLQFEVEVAEQVSGNSETHALSGLGGGVSEQLCGTLPVDSNLPVQAVQVRAEVDPADDVVECREVPQASSCNPASGDDVVTGWADTVCNRPPDCDAGGPYLAECAGPVTSVDLDGSGSSDLDGESLSYLWTTDCPGGIRNAGAARAVLDFDSTGLGCSRSCTVTLTVSDPFFDVSCTADVTVQDTEPPAFTQVPSDLTVECVQQGGAPATHPEITAWRQSFTAEDVCSGVTTSDDMPAFFPSDCSPGHEMPVKVTAADACGLEAEAVRSVWVEDTTPPFFTRVPDDLTVECVQQGGAPASHPEITAWRAGFEGEDLCGSVTDSDDMPPFFPAGCAPGRDTPVTVTLTDNCRLATDEERSVWIEDTTPPAWVRVPDDLTVECSAPGGTPADHPEIVTWRAEFLAEDICGGVTDRDDMPPFFPAGCAPGHETPVTVTAVDDCLLETPVTRSVWVEDTTPPVIEAIDFDGSCLWPPNHKYVCLDDINARVRASDICDPDPQARVAGCSSNQPDDARDDLFPGANGDGHTFNDCAVAPDGLSMCLRSERLGTDPGGRYYSAEIVVTDGCDNDVATSASVHVPHDQSPSRKDCLSPDSPGTK